MFCVIGRLSIVYDRIRRRVNRCGGGSHDDFELFRAKSLISRIQKWGEWSRECERGAFGVKKTLRCRL